MGLVTIHCLHGYYLDYLGTLVTVGKLALPGVRQPSVSPEPLHIPGCWHWIIGWIIGWTIIHLSQHYRSAVTHEQTGTHTLIGNNHPPTDVNGVGYLPLNLPK